MEKVIKKRYLEIDFLRGVAIVLMVTFHFFYDLQIFHYLDLNIYHNPFWIYFRDLIIFLFMLTVGISLYLTNEQHFDLKKNLIRLSKLLAVALLITVVSLFLYPKYWIYFGIIHLIFAASLLTLPLVKKPFIALIFSALILFSYFTYAINMDWLYNLTQSFLHLPELTKDIAHLFPWLGVVYMGIFIGYKRYFDINLRENIVTKSLARLGQYALLIYLIHQPIIMGIMSTIKYFTA